MDKKDILLAHVPKFGQQAISIGNVSNSTQQLDYGEKLTNTKKKTCQKASLFSFSLQRGTYRAYDTARFSRMTVTRICPGYCISS